MASGRKWNPYFLQGNEEANGDANANSEAIKIDKDNNNMIILMEEDNKNL